MEKEVNPVWRNAMTYGALFGGLMSLVRVLIASAGFREYNAMLFPFHATILTTGLYILYKNYRDRYFAGEIDFKKVFRLGFLTCFFTGVTYGFYIYTEFQVLFPENFDVVLKMQEEVLRSGYFSFLTNLNKMDIDTQIKTLHENSSPLTSAFSTIFSVTFWGSLLSLFLAFIIKKKVNVGHGSNNDQKN